MIIYRSGPTGEIQTMDSHCVHPLNSFHKDLCFLFFPLLLICLVLNLLLLLIRLLQISLTCCGLHQGFFWWYLKSSGLKLETIKVVGKHLTWAAVFFIIHLKDNIPKVEYVEILRELKFAIPRGRLQHNLFVD